MQDLITRLNTLGGRAITAGLANPGNGVQITDGTVGAGTLTIEALNASPALEGLGLNVTATGNQLVGRDVNPVRVDSPFTALLELRAGLQTDDRLTLEMAGQRIERVLTSMQKVQGSTASQARQMSERSTRVDSELTATQVLLSDTRDADLTEVAVRFQQLQTALQANLSTAAKVMNLSLLDYLH
jgi:flagellar hook-associated protein 3 FlgL